MLPPRLPFIAGPRRRPIKHLADLGPLPAPAARGSRQARVSCAMHTRAVTNDVLRPQGG